MTSDASSKRNLSRVPVIAGMVLMLAILACSFDASSIKKSPDGTEIARSVEETLMAEKVLTEQALPTVSSLVATTSGTLAATADTAIQTQQAIISGQATDLALSTPTHGVEATSSATISPLGTQAEPISLLDWRARNMRQAPGCGEDKDGPPCWFGREDALELFLIEPIYIDPAWEKPHLTFDHKYVFVQNATIYIKVDGQWRVLWSFMYGKTALWQPFDVDLSDYKGKDIQLQFTVSGTEGFSSGFVKRNEWYISNIRIAPNFRRN